MSTILVTGGTGRAGRRTATLLRDAGATVRVLSRHPGGPDGVEHLTGDLVSGEGVEPAFAGADTVVHCAAATRFPALRAQVRTLVRAASHARTRHLVYISVVGADRIPVVSRIDRAAAAYFAAVRDCEEMIARSGVPWTTLRTSQFFDGFTLVMVQALARLPIVPVPSGWRFQPIDTGEVAARLASLALGPPAGLVEEMAGPRVYTAAEVVRSYLRATHRSRPIVPLRIPGRASRAIRSGANLAPDHAVGRRTWEEFLAEEVAATSGISPTHPPAAGGAGSRPPG